MADTAPSDLDALASTRLEARRLLGLWETLARQHVALGTSCACGAGGVSVRLEDFEQDIADYLLGEAERNRRDATIAFLNAHGLDQASGQWSLARLLSALIAEDGSAAPTLEVSSGLVQRLGRTLSSFAKLHGQGA